MKPTKPWGQIDQCGTGAPSCSGEAVAIPVRTSHRRLAWKIWPCLVEVLLLRCSENEMIKASIRVRSLCTTTPASGEFVQSPCCTSALIELFCTYDIPRCIHTAEVRSVTGNHNTKSLPGPTPRAPPEPEAGFRPLPSQACNNIAKHRF